MCKQLRRRQQQEDELTGTKEGKNFTKLEYKFLTEEKEEDKGTGECAKLVYRFLMVVEGGR